MEPRSFPSLFPSALDNPPLSYSAEVWRKAIHVPALALPIGLLVLGGAAGLWILIALAAFALTADLVRQRVQTVHHFARRVFGPLMRPEELPAFGSPLVLNGATWMMVSAALCAFLFPETIAAAALIMLMVGDSVAALVGRRFGRHRFPGSRKTWEGSLAFLVTAVLGALPLAVPDLINFSGVPALSFAQLGVGALVATIAEAIPVPLNDNLRVPLLAGIAMMLV